MIWSQFGRIARFRFLAVLAPLMLLAAITCTPSEVELLEGLLQNVDAVNGQITIVTKDGRTLTLTISTEDTAKTREASATLGTLEPGDSVEVVLSEEGDIAELEEKGRQSASEFADDCNDDGVVSIQENLKVREGVGTITVACEVTIAPGKTLKITETTLQSDGGSLNIQGGATTELRIDKATVNMGNGELRFTSGDNSVVRVEESRVTGDLIDLGAAPEGMCAQQTSGSSDEGKARVRNSTLTAGGNIRIASGENCETEVRESALTAGGDITIVSGQGGETDAEENEFNSGGMITITAGPGGKCESKDNTPDVDCT